MLAMELGGDELWDKRCVDSVHLGMEPLWVLPVAPNPNPKSYSTAWSVRVYLTIRRLPAYIVVIAASCVDYWGDFQGL